MRKRKDKVPKLSKAEKKKQQQQEEALRVGREMVESYRKQMDQLVETFRTMVQENLEREKRAQEATQRMRRAAYEKEMIEWEAEKERERLKAQEQETKSENDR